MKATEQLGEEARTHTEIGVFASDDEARRAVALLQDAAFAADEVGVLSHDARLARDLAGSRVPELAVAGALSGALAALVVLLAPGSEVLRSGGAPVVAAWVAGAAAGGTVVGVLAGRVLPRRDPGFYERVAADGTVVTVRCTAGDCARARRTLREAGAQEVRGEIFTDAP